MSKFVLAEVFGYPTENTSDEAKRCRKLRLCPYGNVVPNCTKDKANDPLGVCSIHHGDDVIITCPVRFREQWLIAEHSAKFFFPEGTNWTSLSEVRLKDSDGLSAGNIDVVLVSYDDSGRVLDFGALEIQAVYISGNVRNVFELFMKTGSTDHKQFRTLKPPRPDYLSSSRKRLAPQLLFKGGILNTWGKKSAVAMNRSFFETLPAITEVPRTEADLAWIVFDMAMDEPTNRYRLVHHNTVYTTFADCLATLTRPVAGELSDFVRVLQKKLDKNLLTSTRARPLNGGQV